jgi:tetratricopeptide (TPR) repeat protein
LRPDDVTGRDARASARAGLHQWDAAIADWEQALRLNPDDFRVWYSLGLAYLARQNVAAYREHCRRMLERFGQTEDAPAADLTAWLALLLSDAVPDVRPLMLLAQGAHRRAPNSANCLEDLGAALYRAGRYVEAIKRLKEAAEKEGGGGSVGVQLFLAMAYARLGQLTAGAVAPGPPAGPARLLVPAALLSGDAVARGWLEKARTQAAGSSSGWEVEVQRQYLFAETEALLKPRRP